jgi:PA14 domain-containing protein
MSSASPSTPDRLPSAAARPRPGRALVASACLAAALFAADCWWQRAFIPRLMGLQGAWYPNDGWRGEAVLSAVDADLATATLSRRRREIGADAFSVAWTGQLEIAAPGEFTFFTQSGGPVALRIDGLFVVVSRSGEDAGGSTPLAAGRHGMAVLYAQRGGEPRLSLAWARDRQPREPLSAEVLRPPQADERQIAVYRTGRTILRTLLAASVLFAIAALLVVAARRVRALLRERGGLAAAVGLVALLATGAAVLDDFGVSRDETISRQVGIANYLYVSQGATKLVDHDFLDRLYGPAFEGLLAAVEKELGLADSRPIYLVRHGATFLLFCVAVVFFYRLGLHRFRHAPTALFACGMLVLAPRIFADSFYNSKDLPLLSLFVVSVYTLVTFLDEWTPCRALGHALASAVLIDIRIVGLVVPALTLLLATSDLLFARNPGRPRRRRAAVLALYFGGTACFTVALFPYLWTSPVRRLADVFATMSRFPYPMTTLYLGHQLPSQAIPWHYAPVWIGVTTPPAFLALFGLGLVVIARSCLARPRVSFGNPETRNRVLWVLWFFVPLLSVVAIKAPIYSGWRHLYFVYPALVLVAVEGADAIVQAARARLPVPLGGRRAVLAAVACALVFAEPVSFLVRNHPYGNVYFNRFAGADMRTVRDRFDVDYWGLSYRRGLEYVLRQDRRPSIRVLLKPGLGEASAAILPTGQRMRLVFVDRARDADYVLGNYQWHRGEYAFRHEVFAVRTGDADIMTVYDLRSDPR